MNDNDMTFFGGDGAKLRFYEPLQSIGYAEGEPELRREGAARRKRGGNVGIDGWANAAPNG